MTSARRLGRAWRETSEEHTSRATLIEYLLQGQYNNPVRIVALNSAEGWARKQMKYGTIRR
jgi:hypothetical protein